MVCCGRRRFSWGRTPAGAELITKEGEQLPVFSGPLAVQCLHGCAVRVTVGVHSGMRGPVAVLKRLCMPQMRMAGALAPQKACHGMLAQRPGRCGRALAVAPQAVAAMEAPPTKQAKQSKPDGVMGQGPIIINGQVPLRALWQC